MSSRAELYVSANTTYVGQLLEHAEQHPYPHQPWARCIEVIPGHFVPFY